MLFLGLGIVLLLLKYMAIGIVANWSWLAVLSPFALAVIWWAWADASGYTKKKAIQRETQRKNERLNKNREAMGMTQKKR